MGFSDANDISMKRFRDDLSVGDAIIVTTDGLLWAVGEISSSAYERNEPRLYGHRRNVIWYKVTRLAVKSFGQSLRNKLRSAVTLVPLDSEDWSRILAAL